MSYGVPGVIKVKVVTKHDLTNEKEISITNETTLNSFLSTCSSKLNIKAKKIFTLSGQSITNVDHVAPGEKFIITEGEEISNEIRQYRNSQRTNKESTTFNFSIIGPASVGKSSIAVRYVLNQYTADYVPTIEDTYKKFETVDDKLYCLNILDTSGSEDFSTLITQWLHEKDGLILVYSVDKMANFEELKKYVQLLKYHDPEGEIVKIIVANKVDVSTREVTTEEGQNFARDLDAEYIETSAKTDYNVTQAFVTLALAIIRKQREKKESMAGNNMSKTNSDHSEYGRISSGGNSNGESNKGFMNWLFSKCNLI